MISVFTLRPGIPLPGCREPQGHGTAGTGTLNPLGCTRSRRAAGASLGAGCAVWSAGIRPRSPAGSRLAASRRRPAAGQARCPAEGRVIT